VCIDPSNFQNDQEFTCALRSKLKISPNQIVVGLVLRGHYELIPLFFFRRLLKYREGKGHYIYDVQVRNGNELYRNFTTQQQVLELQYEDFFSTHPVLRKSIAKQICLGLQSNGYFQIALSSVQAEIFRKVFVAAERAFLLPANIKSKLRVALPEHHKFAGFADQGARQFYQYRQWGSMDFPWKCEDEGFKTLILSCFKFLGELGRSVLSLIEAALNVLENNLLDLCDTDGGESSRIGAGADVLRLYRYLRPKNEPPPGIFRAATSVHCDMGLLTLCPLSTLPGLMILDPKTIVWKSVEEGATPSSLLIFAGETLCQISKGFLPAALHYVDEKECGLPRFSLPFFLRARPNAKLPNDTRSVADLMDESRQTSPWRNEKAQKGNDY